MSKETAEWAEWIESVLAKWPAKYKTLGEFMESPEGKEFQASQSTEKARELTDEEDDADEDAYDDYLASIGESEEEGA
jgi:hypothetical protein